jgi:transcription elongation GreA/GreB family factor
VHPSIAHLRKKEGEAEEEEEVIWTTKEGYTKIKERIEHIATVETVDNAKEIEIARSHGDLRENSEFKFAQERRSRLQSELRFLSNQMKHMRILTENDIDTSCVGIGTKIELEKADKEKTVYTLLGPWDADPENKILSFQSKLAKSMIGLTVGSTCTILGEEWKVVSITRAI